MRTVRSRARRSGWCPPLVEKAEIFRTSRDENRTASLVTKPCFNEPASFFLSLVFFPRFVFLLFRSIFLSFHRLLCMSCLSYPVSGTMTWHYIVYSASAQQGVLVFFTLNSPFYPTFSTNSVKCRSFNPNEEMQVM